MYAANNPVDNCDPTGRETLVDVAFSSMIASVVGAGLGAGSVLLAGGNATDALEGEYAGATAGLGLALGYGNGKGPEVLLSGLFGGLLSLSSSAILQHMTHPNQPLGPVKSLLSFLKGFGSSALSTATGTSKSSAWDKGFTSFLITGGADLIDIYRKDSDTPGHLKDLRSQLLFALVDAGISGVISALKKNEEPKYITDDDKAIKDVLDKLTLYQVKKIILDAVTKASQAPIKIDVNLYFGNPDYVSTVN